MKGKKREEKRLLDGDGESPFHLGSPKSERRKRKKKRKWDEKQDFAESIQLQKPSKERFRKKSF